MARRKKKKTLHVNDLDGDTNDFNADWVKKLPQAKQDQQASEQVARELKAKS